MSSSCLYVCLSVFAIAENQFPVDCRLLAEERIAYIGIPLDVFAFCCFNDVLCFCVLGSLQTSLLCIMRELAGGGSVAVAVDISDK